VRVLALCILVACSACSSGPTSQLLPGDAAPADSRADAGPAGDAALAVEDAAPPTVDAASADADSSDATVEMDTGPANLDAAPEPDAESQPDAAPLPDSGCPAGTSTIRVRGYIGYESFAGSSTVPMSDAQLTAVTAYLPNQRNALTSYSSELLAPGTAQIPCVPNAPFYWSDYPQDPYGDLTYTATRSIVMSLWHRGRADAVPTTSTTLLQLDLTALEPWRTGDQATMFTPNERWPMLAVTPTIGGGALSIEAQLGFALDAARGDRVEVLVMASTTASASYARQVFMSPPISTPVGADTRVAGALSEPFSTRRAEVDVHLTEYFDEFTMANPGFAPQGLTVTVLALPQHAVHGSIFESPTSLDLEWWQPNLPSRDVSSVVPLVTPSSDEKLVLEVYLWAGDPPLGTPFRFGYATQRTDIDPAFPDPVVVRPVLGPPLNIRINGLDARQSLSGVGTSPTISWDPPAGGVATGYNIDVFDAAGNLAVYVAATGPPVPLPPASLGRGTSYVIGLYAFSHVDGSVSFAKSEASTAPFTP
jgi:hypothetical protein